MLIDQRLATEHFAYIYSCSHTNQLQWGESSEMSSILGYWNVRGLANPLRMMLHYVGESYEDKLYYYGPAPDYSRESWLKEKYTLGLDFPNLPYYIDGDVKITHSSAIARHIARKHGLLGKTEEERCRTDMVLEEIIDFRNLFIGLCFSTPDFETAKIKYLEDLAGKLKRFDEFLGERHWFAGENITFVDFTVYESLEQHRRLQSSCLQDFPRLRAFMTRLQELPRMKDFVGSKHDFEFVFPNVASWTGGKQMENK